MKSKAESTADKQEEEADAKAFFTISDDGVMSATEYWRRDDQGTLERLELAGMAQPPAVDVIATWSDDDVKAVDVWAYATCLSASDNDHIKVPDCPDVLETWKPKPEEPPAAAAAPQPEPVPVPPTDEDDEAEWDKITQADLLQHFKTEDLQAELDRRAALATPDPEPVELSLKQKMVAALHAMRQHRYGLYLTPGLGYSPGNHPPYHEEAVIQACVLNGLAELDPTGGSHGSAKLSEAGREGIKAHADLVDEAATEAA